MMETKMIIWTIISLSFISFFLILFIYERIGLVSLRNALVRNQGILLINTKHFFGILIFGLVYFILFPEYRYLILEIPVPKLGLLFTLLFVLGAIVYVSFMAAEKYKAENEPLASIGFSKAWQYFSLRFLYLLAYEYFFRGILFFVCLSLTSLNWSIFINVLLYALIHVFDSRKELLGSIPLGIVLCLFAYHANSIWIPFIIHLALSAVFEISIFHYSTTQIQKS